MFHQARSLGLVLILSVVSSLMAADPDRNFSGKWVLDLDGSNLRSLSAQPDELLTISQDDQHLQCTSTDTKGAALHWSYALDGKDSKYRSHGESMNSVVIGMIGALRWPQ